MTPSRGNQAFETSRQATLLALEKIDEESLVKLSCLTLPDIRALRQEVARIMPAGRLPAFILSGLLQLKGRTIPADQVRRDVTTLFQGLTIVSQGLYGAFVAGPAAVLSAYQKLLQLAGQNVEQAFPEGTWQFYLQFGLREDAARHANETVGFHHAHRDHNSLDAAMAWVWAIAHFILDYETLLAADWHERVSLRVLSQVMDKTNPSRIVRDWNAQRPYTRQNDKDYIAGRRDLFERFLKGRLAQLPGKAVKNFVQRYQARKQVELQAYQKQMSLLYALKPNRYQEERETIPVWRARVGFIWGGQTFLIPICQRDGQGRPLCYPTQADIPPRPLHLTADDRLTSPDGLPVTVDRGGRVWKQDKNSLLGRLRPLSPEQIKGQLAVILSKPGWSNAFMPAPSFDQRLVLTPRAEQEALRDALPEIVQKQIERLRLAPVILNWDPQPANAPLPYIRQGQRGIGDHALTIFRTARSFVFDQSHIFFDGLWGMAVAELLTNEAIYRYPQVTTSPSRAPMSAPRPVEMEEPPEMLQQAVKKRFPGEAAAENAKVDLHRLARLRRWLSQRGVRLTVNDLLLLYRHLHAAEYQLSHPARRAVEAFRTRAKRSEEKATLRAIDDCLAQMQTSNPALLIPMDASNVAPRERVFPTTFRNPLVEIGAQIKQTYDKHAAYQKNTNEKNWKTFDARRREMLAHLQAFGELLDTLKAVTMRGESFNTATIRLLAHLPASMQNLLDQIPQRIGVLNEIIKGTEVFSNVGRVAPGSSLRRFSSARDDGNTKWLVWGVLTDAQGVMHITLRDFRPFVALLHQIGDPRAEDLANELARDYLDGYVAGFNRFVIKLSAVVSEEKRP